jgi:glycine cleavage system H lipoate-binding protein
LCNPLIFVEKFGNPTGAPDASAKRTRFLNTKEIGTLLNFLSSFSCWHGFCRYYHQLVLNTLSQGEKMQNRAKRESMKIVPPGRNKCVWMEAGVVSYKLCDNNFDCSTCQYDHAMQLRVSRRKEDAAVAQTEAHGDTFNATWVDSMMQLPASQRKCRYMITGEIVRKICPNAYECGNCAFDQMMQERLQAEQLPVEGLTEVAGFTLAQGFYYHEGHTWARPEYGGRVRVGLDDFARRLLGTLSRVQFPDIGQEVKQGAVGFQIQRNGDMVGMASPVDGIVVHINDRILNDPEVLSASPYENGWLYIVEPTRLRKNLKGLYYGEEARKYLTEERERLLSLANEDMKIDADGSVPLEDMFPDLKGNQWSKFAKLFFRT